MRTNAETVAVASGGAAEASPINEVAATETAKVPKKVELAAKKKHRSWLLSQPSAAFLRDRHFYTKYDTVWALIFVAVIATCVFSGWQGFAVGWWALPVFVVMAYLQMLSGALVHNAVHDNFPRSINRLMGELTGLFVGTRYASWEILHRYHHMHSDHEKLDPHPVNPGFWKFFFKKMLGNLEFNLRHQYLERWGDTPQNRRYDRFRTIYSALTAVLMFAAWFFVMGPFGFFAVFLPALAIGAVHVSHFNWVTHGASDPDRIKSGDFRPINIDSGVYWLGNRLLFGIYFHANHHAYVKAFDPRKLDSKLAAKSAQKVSKHRVARGLPE